MSLDESDSIPAEQPGTVNLELAVDELFKAVNSALDNQRGAALELVERARQLLALKGGAAPGAPAEGTGVPWRIRRAQNYIAANLPKAISMQSLADVAGLSVFHFSRTFRDCVGDSPHRYILRQRIARSQALMLTTRTSLAQIALECGLVDQAHLGRMFRRFVGETPAAWRRARA